MDKNLQGLIKEMGDLRQQILERLQGLSEAELECKTEFYDGRLRTVRFILYQMGRHEREHLTHLRKLRRALGRPQSEVQMILAQNEESRGQFFGELIGLKDNDLERAPAEGEWSIRQLLEHHCEIEQRYLNYIEKALATPSSA